jgi:hypothetical protein
MAFGTLYGPGVKFTDVFTPPAVGDYNYGEQPAFEVGTLMFGSDGTAFIYVEFGTGGATGLGYVCDLNPATYEAVMTSTSTDLLGGRLGVAQAAAVAGDYGWLQVLGPCQVFGVASALANNRVAATATAGVVDDAGAVGTLYIQGLIFTTAVGGGGNALAAADLNWPAYQQVGTYA